uniref:SKP1 component POZ domain-containing protein n=1 Tax=Lotus japonicus TaxID=34305 RepID=I3SE65_LOTJA|nr:unknown [Lotus japonicus]
MASPSLSKEMKAVEIFIDDDDKAFIIPLPEVSSQDLVKIIEYCKQRRTAANAKDFDAEFAKALNNKELLSLIAAANYLNMADLLDLLSQCIVDRV